jgi:uncharacterized protein YbjQ (UPF0145 family)
MRRFTESPVHSSLLSVRAAVSIDSVGFDPVGEVMGAAVMQLGWTGTAGCGHYLGAGAAKVYGSNSQWGGFGPYIKVVLAGYRLAMSRLVAEAAAMHADGIVGIKIATRHLGDDDHEYTAMGTAVRARSRVRPDQPFTTDLDGPDVTALLIGGWVPVSLEIAMEMAIRHDDGVTRSQESFRSRTNVEISGHTELAQYVRNAVRQRLASQVRSSGADGLVVSRFDFSIRGSSLGGHLDHVAEALVFGNSIASFRRGEKRPPPPLSMLVL